jgi:hypothetical protein
MIPRMTDQADACVRIADEEETNALTPEPDKQATAMATKHAPHPGGRTARPFGPEHKVATDRLRGGRGRAARGEERVSRGLD